MSSSNDPLIGRQLGDYTVQGLLGQGGMARVYRGYDAKLDRYAAVKVIEPNLVANDEVTEYRERFQREARAIAKLNHPNIVGVYQFGTDPQSALYYMAMAFIEGRDLRQILKEYIRQEKRLPYSQIVKIARDIANALDYAHKNGVIHRDVKPSNIMITTGDGRAVLTDFGLALNAQEGTIGNTFGSVHYIAPEQAVSSANAVPQSDLYSLGVIVYEMATGRLPFEDVSAMSVALKHISDPPPPPSTINPKITPEIEAVILKALDKDPTKRFATSKAMVDALEAAVESAARRDISEVDSSPSKPSRLLEEVVSAGASAPGTMPTIPGGVMSQDGPTITDSSRNRPGTLPFAPLDDDHAHKRKTIPTRSSGALLAGGVVVLAVVALGLFVVLSILGGDDDGANTGANAGVNADATGTALALAALPTDTPEPTATPLPTDTAEPTELVAQETPTDTPAPPTPTLTATLTLTPTPTPEPTATPTVVHTPTLSLTASADDAHLVLRYDSRSLVVYNRAPDNRIINIINLTFTQGGDDALTFNATEWTTGNLRAVRPERCYQVWTVEFRQLPPEDFPAEICQSRLGFNQTTRTFWVAQEPEAVFQVMRGTTQLAECPAAADGSLEEVYCLVDLDN